MVFMVLGLHMSQLHGPAVSFGVRSRKLSNIGHKMGDQKFVISSFTLRHVKPLGRLHLQSLAPTYPHWARVAVYGPFYFCVIHKESLCPSSGDINRLMMMLQLQYSS
jgi:hypothetical protein